MSDQVHAERREPEQPEGAFDLHAAAAELLEQAGEVSAGRAARTLTPGAGGPLSQTLLAITAGGRLAEHQAPGPATLQVLSGEVALHTQDGTIELPAGYWAVVPRSLHEVEAHAASALLLTVAVPEP